MRHESCGLDKTKAYVQIGRTRTLSLKRKPENVMFMKSEENSPLAADLSDSCKIGGSLNDDSLVSRAVNAHHHFNSHQDTIHIEIKGSTVILTGRLPSFYLKQLLQETVRHVKGVQQIQNEIDVICCDGVSSTPD